MYKGKNSMTKNLVQKSQIKNLSSNGTREFNSISPTEFFKCTE